MREINETEEAAAELQRKKRRILAVVAVGVVSASFYGWWNKTREPVIETQVSRNDIVEAAKKTQGDVVVYVSGRVEHPGVVKVIAGSRAIDVVNAAGGLLSGADVAKINLAQVVKDGMQIHVPGQPIIVGDANQIQYSGPTGTLRNNAPATGTKRDEEKININTAEASELDKLPGVGPAMAAKIVEYRKANGAFHDGEDLKKVKGLSDAKYQKLKDKISW